MQIIKYRFADGTTSEIEVTDEFYTLYTELVQQEKRNHWKETRRHISLEYLNENGIDFASPAADLLSVLIQQEDEKRIHKAMAALSDKQRGRNKARNQQSRDMDNHCDYRNRCAYPACPAPAYDYILSA